MVVLKTESVLFTVALPGGNDTAAQLEFASPGLPEHFGGGEAVYDGNNRFARQANGAGVVFNERGVPGFLLGGDGDQRIGRKASGC